MSHCGNDEIGQNALCGRYLNNRRTGKDTTKPRTLGLLGHSVLNPFTWIFDDYFSLWPARHEVYSIVLLSFVFVSSCYVVFTHQTTILLFKIKRRELNRSYDKTNTPEKSQLTTQRRQIKLLRFHNDYDYGRPEELLLQSSLCSETSYGNHSEN